MDMFDSESFDNKLDLRNDEVSIAKGEWLHLEMNLRTVVHQGKNSIIVFTRSFVIKLWLYIYQELFIIICFWTVQRDAVLNPVNYRQCQFDCRAMLGHPRRTTTLARAKNWWCLPQHPYGTTAPNINRQFLTHIFRMDAPPTHPSMCLLMALTIKSDSRSKCSVSMVNMLITMSGFTVLFVFVVTIVKRFTFIFNSPGRLRPHLGTFPVFSIFLEIRTPIQKELI